MEKTTETRVQKFFALRVKYDGEDRWIAIDGPDYYFASDVANEDVLRYSELPRGKNPFDFAKWDLDDETEVQFVPVEIRYEITFG